MFIEVRKISKPNFEDILFWINEYKGIYLFSNTEYNSLNIIGISPFLEIIDDGLEQTRKDFLNNLFNLFLEYRHKVNKYNYWGLLGYISYDYKHYIERKNFFNGIEDDVFPLFYFALFNYYIIYKNEDETAILIKVNTERDLNSNNKKINLSKYKIELVYHTQTEEEFIKNVKKIKDYIRAGDVYQVNLTRKVIYKTNIDFFTLSYKLYNSNFIDFGVIAKISDEKYIISTSPERFFYVKSNKIVSSPIKGTIKNKNNMEDIKKYLLTKKNLSELAMIVDLIRNDISRFCIVGSVVVKNFPIIKTLNNVIHLYSDIEGEIEDFNIEKIFRALFPGGSITGCPKIRSMQIIEELEKYPRGIYTGSFGYIFFNNELNFNILIRTIEFYKGFLRYGVGGGITLLSDPVEEYKEILYKAQNIEKVLNNVFI